MEFVFTDEKDEKFLQLVEELDRGYFELIGDELSKYDEYNEFSKPHVVLLAVISGMPVACASFRVFSEDSVEFKRVYVKKDFRRKGIASDLIKKLEDEVSAGNFRHSYIVTGKNNHAAIGLYEKFGYVFIDNLGQFENDEAVVCMKKDFFRADF